MRVKQASVAGAAVCSSGLTLTAQAPTRSARRSGRVPPGPAISNTLQVRSLPKYVTRKQNMVTNHIELQYDMQQLCSGVTSGYGGAWCKCHCSYELSRLNPIANCPLPCPSLPLTTATPGAGSSLLPDSDCQCH
jgi:hypothetical protein